MTRTATNLALLAGLVAPLLAGCAAPGDDRGRPRDDFGYPYTWSGSGEAGDFAADHAQCRRDAAIDAGGPSYPYDRLRPRGLRVDAAVARALRSCLEGCGWRPD